MPSLFSGAAEDLAAAVLYEFGETVLYRGIGHADVSIDCTFRNLVDQVDAPGWVAEAFIRAPDIPFDVERGNQIIRGTEIFTVIDFTADEGGGITLKLRRA